MKMQHVTIQTNRFEEEIKFYENVVGLTIQRDNRPEMDLVFLAGGQVKVRNTILIRRTHVAGGIVTELDHDACDRTIRVLDIDIISGLDRCRSS